MKRNFILLFLMIFAFSLSAQDFGVATKTYRSDSPAPAVTAHIVKNIQSGDSKAVYNPSDSPGMYDYSFDTYTELGWTDINVTEVATCGVVTIDFTYDVDTWTGEPSIHMQSPTGTSVVVASGIGDGTYSYNLLDFMGEAMNGNWMLWIEDSYGDGGAHMSAISVNFNEALANDMGVTAVLPTFVLSGSSAIPQVTVFNFGANDQSDYDLQVVIDDGTKAVVYDETVNITTTLTSGSSTVIDLPEWATPGLGEYTITATVMLTGDENTDNDAMTVGCSVLDAQISYTVNSTTSQFASILLPMGDETPIGAFSVANFPMAMEYAADGNYYVIRNAPAVLSTVDISTGAETVIGTMSGMTGTPTGLAYDWDNDIMYICVLNGSSLPQLGTIDLTTAAATLIGTGATGMLIAMDFDNDGNLFAPSLSPDELFQIDLTTGATTSIGAIGFDLNYGQDVSFDKTAGVMYGTLYDNSGAGGVLCTIDLTTGAATQLYPYADQHACFAIPYAAAVSYNVTFNVNMADSIASGYFVEGTDQLWVGGSMNSWTMPGDDAMYEMAESATNDIYTLTMPIADGDYMYKYFKIVGGVSSWDNGEWNGDPNREFSMAGADVELNDVFGVQPIGINTITNSISVYPNPSNGVFNIKVESLTKLEVFDITGKMIHTQSVNGLTSIQLNNAGVYFLRFSNNEGTAVQRVVVK